MNNVPVFLEVTKRVTFRMGIFDHEIGLIVDRFLPEIQNPHMPLALLQFPDRRVHGTVDIVGVLRHVVIGFTPVVRDQARGIRAPDVVTHHLKVNTDTGFIPQRPGKHRRVILVSFNDG